jgi:NAD(P) transhydrogenase
MSSPVNCLAGYRFALRPRGSRGGPKVNASTFTLRLSTVFYQEFHSKHLKSLQPSAAIHGLTRQRPLSLQQYVAKSQTAVASFASVAEPHEEELPTSPPFSAGLYANLSVGVPKESYPGERRVAMTPQNVKLLLKKGFSRVLIERGAGTEAEFTDEAYMQAGAKIVDHRSVFSESDILLKVRALSIDGADSEVDAIREHATIISFLYPVQNKPVVDRIASRNATSFAMDMIPRISRSQVFDALRWVNCCFVTTVAYSCMKARWRTSLGTKLSWKPRTILDASLQDR